MYRTKIVNEKISYALNKVFYKYFKEFTPLNFPPFLGKRNDVLKVVVDFYIVIII